MYHTIWVCASKEAADNRQKIFGRNAHVLVIKVGDIVGGIRANEIIVDDIYADAGDSKTMYQHISRWFDDSVRCRLVPKGTVKCLTGPLPWKL